MKSLVLQDQFRLFGQSSSCLAFTTGNCPKDGQPHHWVMGGPLLGEHLLKVLELETPEAALPSKRASSTDLHPVSDGNPSTSCDYLFHTFLPFRTLLSRWIYGAPNKQCFIKLGTFPFILPSRLRFKGTSVKTQRVTEGWQRHGWYFFMLHVPHKCKVIYSIIFVITATVAHA